MALAEVLTHARALPRREQLRLIQELAAGLQAPESELPIEPGRDYPVWSPDSAYGAAAALLAAVEAPEGRP